MAERIEERKLREQPLVAELVELRDRAEGPAARPRISSRARRESALQASQQLDRRFREQLEASTARERERGRGTSLGGMRPKCTVVDEDGRLAIGKFPSVADARSVTRGEVLALLLAAKAGINVVPARIVRLEDVPVAVISRFDRDESGARIPYQSAATLLQASREEDRSYTEIVDAIRAHGHDPTPDVQQLWRRLVFNLMITNVDDHLQNHGFLHVEHGLWRLAPAFDLNPFPDKQRESKTWLSEQDGPITDVQMLLARCDYFALNKAKALVVLKEVHAAVSKWRKVATSSGVGLSPGELDDFASAFEHEQMDEAATLAG